MLYHGTTECNAKSIKKHGFRVPMLDILEVERNKRYWNKSIGPLGYGLYTFESDPSLAFDFASKFDTNNPIVFRIPDIIPKENLLDLTDENANLLFIKFCKEIRNSSRGEKIYKHVRYNKKLKSYAGIMIELFIVFLEKKYKKKIWGVKRWEETYLPNVKHSVGVNGKEVTIRNSSLINMREVKLLRKEDFYGS